MTKRLTESRARTHAGFVSCIERGVAEGALIAGTDARAMAAVFNGFLLGLSTLVRDGIRHPVFDVSITQVMKLWDVSAG